MLSTYPETLTPTSEIMSLIDPNISGSHIQWSESLTKVDKVVLFCAVWSLIYLDCKGLYNCDRYFSRQTQDFQSLCFGFSLILFCFSYMYLRFSKTVQICLGLYPSLHIFTFIHKWLINTPEKREHQCWIQDNFAPGCTCADPIQKKCIYTFIKLVRQSWFCLLSRIFKIWK